MGRNGQSREEQSKASKKASSNTRSCHPNLVAHIHIDVDWTQTLRHTLAGHPPSPSLVRLVEWSNTYRHTWIQSSKTCCYIPRLFHSTRSRSALYRTMIMVIYITLMYSIIIGVPTSISAHTRKDHHQCTSARSPGVVQIKHVNGSWRNKLAPPTLHPAHALAQTQR